MAMTRDASQSKGPRCPICKAQAATAYMPFCSKRCADIDLGKWFNNTYAIPGAAEDDDAETPANAERDDDDNGS
jgi:endogenous inhibitor of DNA gyrase (YacG/DUF329 family)